MSKPTLSVYIREHLKDMEGQKDPGPFVTISRQYGCDGYQLADLLLEKVNALEGSDKWKLYKKDILKQLADDVGLAEEVIEKERMAKPSLLKDFMRGIRRGGIPDGYEIRNKITIMVRTVAFEGYAIIVGQGGTVATADLENGLSVRLEAPKEWRIMRVSRRENLTRNQAISRIEQVEQERRHLRRIYEERNPRIPAFNLTIDNSMFSVEQVAEQIILAMKQKNLIGK